MERVINGCTLFTTRATTLDKTSREECKIILCMIIFFRHSLKENTDTITEILSLLPTLDVDLSFTRRLFGDKTTLLRGRRGRLVKCSKCLDSVKLSGVAQGEKGKTCQTVSTVLSCLGLLRGGRGRLVDCSNCLASVKLSGVAQGGKGKTYRLFKLCRQC